MNIDTVVAAIVILGLLALVAVATFRKPGPKNPPKVE